MEGNIRREFSGLYRVIIDMNNGISKRQNETQNIEFLAAQRQLYYEAKRITFYQFISSVLIPIILPVLKRMCSSNNKQLAFITLMSILIIILNTFFIEKAVNNKRIQAAKIQELFDTNVLQINWNNELCESKEVAYKGVKRKAEQYKKRIKSLENLMNWYPIPYSTVDILAGRIMCQKVNVSWDNEVRRKFQNFLLIIIIISSVLIISYSIYENKPFTDTLISIIAPLLPIVLYVFKRYCENKDTISRLEKLNEKTELLWEQVMKMNTTGLDLEKCSRELQNNIFKHRSNALMIWDCFYMTKRDNQEIDMVETANNIVNEYKKIKGL
jgi:hypothetical protein